MQSIHQQYLHSKYFNMLVIKSRALSYLEANHIILMNELIDNIPKEFIFSEKFKEE